jgi:hypothetical protein
MHLQVPYKEMMQRVHEALKGQQQQQQQRGLQQPGAQQGGAEAEHSTGQGASNSGGSSSSVLRSDNPVQLVREDDPVGEVAKNFRVPGHKGSVSFITSMTSHFCGDCNR